MVCIYLIVSLMWFPHLWSRYIIAAYHIWLIIFWAVNLGLLAYLAGNVPILDRLLRV
jgi:hypothetical protein